ncbi:MAG: family 78 glycoside hydrolase catalytic domain [Bacteroidales bacterium]|nr:family 78 glycoside hydrolase catalytic domain [Bacteroidales bacterium]
MMRHFYPLLLFAMLLTACGDNNIITISSPTVELQDGSLPLYTSLPRFSWCYESEVSNVVQTEYRIIVASSEENIGKGIGDLWDTKTVTSNQMLYIPYEGKPLKSRDRCWWKVYTTVTYGDHNKKKTIESNVQHFEISLLSPDDWRAHWIGRDYEDDNVNGHTAIAARYLRKEFTLKKNIAKARLYISGLGVYSAYINGEEAGADEFLKPTLSDYTRRIYFNAYDVTSLVRADGLNAVGVILAGGRFTTVRHNSDYLEWCGILHAAHYGLPQLLMQLEVTYQDGTTDTIVSGNGWKITNQGPIRKSNEFDGETYDARMNLGDWTMPGYDDSLWQEAVVDYDRQNMYREDIYNPRHRVAREYPVVTGSPLPNDYQRPDPMQLLTPQPNPNIKVQQTLLPINIFQKGDKWIVDMGQNMVGVISMWLYNMQKGDTITFRYAETLNTDSSLYTDNLRSAECTDRYIANDGMDHWSPLFTYHGFRYVEISGLRFKPMPGGINGLVLYDEMPMTGSFETSNEIINAVYRNATWGIRGNYRSMPTDCPQRDERMGWTGDRTTGNYGESLIFDNHRLYAKWLQDLEDSQFENGSLPDVAPAYWRNYTDNMTWPGAFITVADMIWRRFGDFRPVEQHYDAMKRWLLHMKKYYLKEGILIRDTYGDWCVPPESPELIHSRDTNRITWPACLSTPYYFHYCTLMKGFAILLDKDDDVVYFQNEMELVEKAYNEKYLDSHTCRYANNTVTANVLPLDFGMVPGYDMQQKVFANIIDKTEKDFGSHVSTGVVGIQHLMRTLTDYGRGDLALRMATDTTYPSWGYMVKNGATTIWELWNGDTGDPAMNSGNHVMLLGDLIIWYYEYLGGIKPLTPGYSKIMLKPYPIKGLDHVNCSYQSVSGLIESKWHRKGNRFEWDILIPANTTAKVYLPTKDGYEERRVLCSGRHHLTSRL